MSSLSINNITSTYSEQRVAQLPELLDAIKDSLNGVAHKNRVKIAHENVAGMRNTIKILFNKFAKQYALDAKTVTNINKIINSSEPAYNPFESLRNKGTQEFNDHIRYFVVLFNKMNRANGLSETVYVKNGTSFERKPTNKDIDQAYALYKEFTENAQILAWNLKTPK